MPTKKRKRATPAPLSAQQLAFKDNVVAAVLKGKLPQEVDDDTIEWLLGTREAHAFILRLDPNNSELQNLIQLLISFYTSAQERRKDLFEGVKQRMIELETQTGHQDMWVPLNIIVGVPQDQLLPPDLGMKLAVAPQSSPNGLVVQGFVNNPIGQHGPVESANNVCVGDIITRFRPGTGIGSSAVRASINMFVNLSVLRMFAPMGGAGGGGGGGSTGNSSSSSSSSSSNTDNTDSSSQTTLPVLPVLPAPSSVTLSIVRLDEASVVARQTTRNRALSPARLSFVSASPLLVSYARATHPKRGDNTLWLLNRTSVINAIVAPLERQNELAALFAKKKVALLGDQGVLNKVWTSPLPKMYDLFTVPELVQKFIDGGEVGRGRNKTSLKTSKQVVNVVVIELKKGGLL